MFRIKSVSGAIFLASATFLQADEVYDKNGNYIITVPPKNGTQHEAYQAIIQITADERVLYKNQPIALRDLIQTLKHDGIKTDSRILMRVDSNCKYPFLREVLKVLGDDQPGRSIAVSTISGSITEKE